MIGARYEARLPNDFFFRWIDDIGWRFPESGAPLLVHRAIGKDHQDGDISCDMVTHGPVPGVKFKL